MLAVIKYIGCDTRIMYTHHKPIYLTTTNSRALLDIPNVSLFSVSQVEAGRVLHHSSDLLHTYSFAVVSSEMCIDYNVLLT